MTDLVIRLCAWERVFPCDEGKPEGSLYLEAAARIEELENEIKEIKKMAKWDLSKLEKAANEEARHGNREALEAMTNKYDSLMGLIDATLQDLDDGVPACDTAYMIRLTLAKLDKA